MYPLPMNGELAKVQCPSCYEFFGFHFVIEELEGESVDYDCEVCCRPMVIEVRDGVPYAYSLED